MRPSSHLYDIENIYFYASYSKTQVILFVLQVSEPNSLHFFWYKLWVHQFVKQKENLTQLVSIMRDKCKMHINTSKKCIGVWCQRCVWWEWDIRNEYTVFEQHPRGKCMFWQIKLLNRLLHVQNFIDADWHSPATAWRPHYPLQL